MCIRDRSGTVSKIVTVAAYKGGVGKTTLALELAYVLRAPLVDFEWDSGGASRRWGYRHERSTTRPLLDALAHPRTPKPLVGHRKADLVPGHPDLSDAALSAENVATGLGKWAAEWERPWVVVDTHPGGFASTLGAMAAADVLVVPTPLRSGERQQRIALTATEPTPARWSRYVDELRAVAEAVRSYGDE